jgi:hypothetical protein
LQIVENQRVFSHCKATAKLLQRILQNSKLLKIKHLMKFFAVLQSTAKTYTQARRPAPPVGTIFAGKMPVFSIHISITAKLQKQKTKTNQTIDRVGFGSFAVFFAVALQWLCSFLHFCKKSTILNPLPTPHLAQHHHKTVEIQALT